MEKEPVNHPATETSRSSPKLGKIKEIAKRPVFLAAIGSACFLALIIWSAITLIGTSPKKDETPPITSNVSASSITESTAVISWTTDEPAISQIIYRQLDSDEIQTTPEAEGTFTTQHSIILSNLKPGTVYWLNIESLDESGNRANYDAGSIKTLAKSVTTPEIGNQVGDKAPDFTLTTIYGDNVTLSDFEGKIIMLNFWLYGCPNCDKEMPYIQSIYEKWPSDKLAVLTIDVPKATDDIEYFTNNTKYLIEKKGVTYPNLLDSEGKIFRMYNPLEAEFPITFFIDTKGIIREIKRGAAETFKGPEEIESILKSL